MKQTVDTEYSAVRCTRRAMATCFEVFLEGTDNENLRAVGEAILDEVQRIERLLSCHDPAAEVYRINQEAAAGRVRVDPELFGVLATCRSWNDVTGGFFDITGGGDFSKVVDLDPDRRSVRFRSPCLLDLGGFGKGYALDTAAELLQHHGVEAALLHGGGSSILPFGTRATGEPWVVELRDPFDDERQEPMRHLPLTDRCFSCSAVVGHDSGSDIIDPKTAKPRIEVAACYVLANSATTAEVLSTALLAMGRQRANAFLEAWDRGELTVGWARPRETETEWEWLFGEAL